MHKCPSCGNHQPLTPAPDVQQLQNDYNWRSAFSYARGYKIADVVRIIYKFNGCNDGDNWVGVFQMKDGMFIIVDAGCDYTGWDCRSWGKSWSHHDLQTLAAMGLSAEHRRASGLTIKEDCDYDY